MTRTRRYGCVQRRVRRARNPRWLSQADRDRRRKRRGPWVLTAGGSQSDGLERVTTAVTVQRFYIRQTCTVAVHGLLSAPDGSLLLTEHGGPAAVVRLDVPALRRTHQFTSG